MLTFLHLVCITFSTPPNTGAETKVVDSYNFEAWIAEHIAMETEGERTPAQTEPHPVVMDESTPALLRKQAA